MFILCDLDGTVADNSHRDGFIQSEKKDWDAFYNPELILQDKPIESAIRVVQKFLNHEETDLKFSFLTGRPEKTREATEAWLEKHLGGMPPEIFMRADGDHSKASDYKEKIINNLYKYGPFLFIDDDLRNADMYWSYGVFLHAPGCWDHFPLTGLKYERQD